MDEFGSSAQRLPISYFEGVNSQVSQTIAKITEPVHVENARSKIIGTIEKREGQVVVGTNSDGQPFITNKNYALFDFRPGASDNYLFRISTAIITNLFINIFDEIHPFDSVTQIGSNISNTYLVYLSDSISVIDPMLGIDKDPRLAYEFDKNNVRTINTPYMTIYPVETPGSIFQLRSDQKWTAMTDTDAQNIYGHNFNVTSADGDLYLVNLYAKNRYIKSDGTTVIDAAYENVVGSASDVGNLWNSPRAALVDYYKARLYLGNFFSGGSQLKTSVIRSSYKAGLISLIANDKSAADTETWKSGLMWTIDVTDNKYLYAGDGNRYEVYRGQQKIADLNLVIGSVSSGSNFEAYGVYETYVKTSTDSITFIPGYTGFLASDEIWVAGTYSGPKFFKWPYNASSDGQNVKQYDTFKLGGDDDQELTMMTNIGNVMMIANNNSMASWNDYTLENFDIGVGCASPRGFAKLLGSLYFIHYTGIYATGGTVPQLLSSKVDRYIKGATKQGIESSVVGVKERSIFFTIGHVTLYAPDGSTERTLRSVCLEYNVVQQQWYVHTNIKADAFELFIDGSNQEKLMLSDSSGIHSVKEFLNGNTDDGQAIPMRVDMSPITYSKYFEDYSNPGAIVVETERGTAMTVFVKHDDGEWFENEGTVYKGVNSIRLNGIDSDKETPPLVRKTQFSFRDSSKQLCRLLRAAVIYRLTTINDNQ